MTYLNTLEGELKGAGIPAGCRRRILAEFADHLHENPSAQLGDPRELARQFADELGTRMARTTAYRIFAALAFAGISLAAMFLATGRMRGLTFAGGQRTPTPGWAAPLLMLAVLAAQVALAAGGLALLRAWRLRHAAVISRAEATVLARRSSVAAFAGAVAVSALPVSALAFPRQAGSLWSACAWAVAGITVAGLAAVLPALLCSARLVPAKEGPAGDLVDDLGPWAPASLTPLRCTLIVMALIVVVLTAVGALANDGYDGAARGVADALACLAGFAVLGRYLGLRSDRPIVPGAREAAQ